MAKNIPRGKRANRCNNENVPSSGYGRQRNNSPRFPTFIQQRRDDRPSELKQLLGKSHLIGDSIYVKRSSKAVTVTPTGEKLLIPPGKNLEITLEDEVFCTKITRSGGDRIFKECKTERKRSPRPKERRRHSSKTSTHDYQKKCYKSLDLISGRVKTTERFNQYCQQSHPVLPDNLLQSWSVTKFINVTTQTRPEKTPRMQETLPQEALHNMPGVSQQYQLPVPEDCVARPASRCQKGFQVIASIFTVVTILFALVIVCYDLQLPQHLHKWYKGPEVKPKTRMEILQELFLQLLDL